MTLVQPRLTGIAALGRRLSIGALSVVNEANLLQPCFRHLRAHYERLRTRCRAAFSCIERVCRRRSLFAGSANLLTMQSSSLAQSLTQSSAINTTTRSVSCLLVLRYD